MSLSTAKALAWSLAAALMVCITLFEACGGSFSVVPEFDGEPETVVHVYDPPLR